MASALDILRSKTSTPSEFRTAQWNAVPIWIRERAFFMAAVDRAEVLDNFRASVDEMVQGKLSLGEARERLRGQLNEAKYQPLPGQEGTIKDLRTQRRMDVALNVNVMQVEGFSRWMRQQQTLEDFPAQRLVRVRMSKVPRDWSARWAEALARTGNLPGATGPDEMVALVNHPIWVALSVFGTPFPPFDYNSGMGIEPVDIDEAEALGIMPASNSSAEHLAMMEVQDRGLNETLEASPAVRSEMLRNALADSLQGFAEWQNNRLVFSDPNGTKSYTAEALAKVITKPLPDGFPALQRDALEVWANDSGAIKYKGGSDKAEDLIRMMLRTEPLPSDTPLWRGEGFETRAAFNARLNELVSNGGIENDGIAMSFSQEADTALLAADRKGPFRLVYHLDRHYSARDISPSVEAIAPDHAPESEAVFTHGRRFRIVEKPWLTETPQGPIWNIKIEEVQD